MATEAAEALAFAMLTTPRLLAEWHEDMGPQLWWCLEEGKWLGEAPYVGSPLDEGKEVLIVTQTYTMVDGSSEQVTPYQGMPGQRLNIGGWPGYHTHFTPLPPMPEAPSACVGGTLS